MSKLALTTQELFLRLGGTAHVRSTRADLLFRRLRAEKPESLAESLSKASWRFDASIMNEPKGGPPEKVTAEN